MSENLFVEMNLKFVAGDINPVELVTLYANFLQEYTELVSRSGRKTPIEIIESNFVSIIQYDEEDNERHFLDAKGNLQLTDEEIEDAIKKGLIGEAI